MNSFRKEVDELNVYPVPDGDTGTNMSMTIGNALAELRRMDDSTAAGNVAETMASALLRGARGNSGVILSLLFRGFAKGLAGCREVSSAEIARALELGVEAAYKSVMKPTEGTILTVARLSSVKASKLALDPKYSENLPLFWQEICAEAERALEQTPELLPVLKKAGVVDAGGKGLLIIWKAMGEIFNGKSLSSIEADSGGQAQTKTFENSGGKRVNPSSIVGMVDEEITFTYCTEALIKKQSDLDPLRLRAFLETVGDCAVVVDDDEVIKCHVHTEHPGKVLEEALLFGSLINIKIENMREQHESKVKESKMPEPIQKAEPTKPYGFVAVVSGGGMETLFKDLGADTVVRGGQTMNPSTDDILRAIEATPAETVFVLPNNKNIIMAAEQAVKLADKRVCVLQTRFIPQGIGAMLAFDPDKDFSQNRVQMTKALEQVLTGQITFAARNSDHEGHPIKQGEILGLENGKLTLTDKDVNRAAYRVLKRLLHQKPDFSYITIIYGSDVSDETAGALQAILNQKLADKAEVSFINGGQPVYYYIMAVE